MPAGDAEAEQQGAREQPTDSPAQPERRPMSGDDYLIPGPSAESNEGLGRWGLSWLIFSLALIVMMALMSYVCWVLARWTGLA